MLARGAALTLAAALAPALASCSAAEPGAQQPGDADDNPLDDLVMVTTTLGEVGDIELSGGHLVGADAELGADRLSTPGSEGDPELAADVKLRGDGLGVASFGDDSDLAIAQITAALGTPLIDSGWLGTDVAYGSCPATQVRALEWAGLKLLFSDADDRYSASAPADTHFMSWEVIIGDPLRLATPEGINPGVTRDIITEVYPLVSLTEASGDERAQAQITTPNGQMRVWFADNSVATSMFAGTPCG